MLSDKKYVHIQFNLIIFVCVLDKTRILRHKRALFCIVQFQISLVPYVTIVNNNNTKHKDTDP